MDRDAHVDDGGSTDAGTPASNGTMGGADIAFQSAASNFAVTSTGMHTVQVVLDTTTMACAVAGQLNHHAQIGSHSMWLVVGSETARPGVGTYPVSSGSSGGAAAIFWAANTGSDDNKTYLGTITLDAVSETEVSGSYDLTFENGHVAGQFRAPNCKFDSP